MSNWTGDEPNLAQSGVRFPPLQERTQPMYSKLVQDELDAYPAFYRSGMIDLYMTFHVADVRMHELNAAIGWDTYVISATIRELKAGE